MPKLDYLIRPAKVEDLGEIYEMLRELAEYEKIEHAFVATPGELRSALFERSDSPAGLVAENDAGGLIGYAIYFENFSSFLARRGIYLEDVYVRTPFRGHGVGRSFLRELARIAVERGSGRMEWTVLDWNHDAIDFYESLGASVLPDWRVVRMDRTAIAKLSEQD